MLSEATIGLTRWDFDFDRREVAARTSQGTRYTRSVCVGMPKIPQEILRTTFFLYATEDDAKADVHRGGTGFFIIKHLEGGRGPGVIYAVSNWHVVVSGGYSVIRINTVDGGFEVLALGPEEWTFKASDYDLAAYPVPFEVDPNRHAVRALSSSMLLTREGAEEYGVGPGENVFMVGLFVDHHHATAPALRFGHISMDPAPIKQSNGATMASYCIDVHSRTGFSGSPVFAWRSAGDDLTTQGNIFAGHFLMFLGVHFAQFPEQWEVVEGKPRKMEEASLPQEGKFVRGMSGMTCVAPSWAVLDLLDHGRLREAFAETREQWASSTRLREKV